MARKPNFSSLEIETLIEEFQNHKEVLNSSFNNTSTNASKQRAWASVASKVSSVSGVTRTADDVKKKWRNVSSDSKKKLSHARKEATKTGGGSSSAVELSATELRVLETMGQTATEGIPGGIDTAGPSSSNTNLQETFITDSDQQESVTDATSKTTRKRKRSSGNEEAHDLVEIERERLEVEKKRLELEERRLYLEQRRYDLEVERHSRGFMVCDSQKVLKYYIVPAGFTDFMS
ncbi:myb/SANT-like DNA-binding domain-containing protein 4 [Saccostrea cucullata]|uniref:myb/SANT-like DNA-binding domain-containing protein 4 n=1 Tax=Saccostrea cuccullata TaxID=36930 RepID=UPI002ED141C7